MRIRFLLSAVLLTLSFPAAALQHLMSVREVYVGPADAPEAQYVLLQMYQHFQNQVGGHAVSVFDATGNLIESYTFANHVPVLVNQSYILIATAEAEERFGVTADLRMMPTLPAGGGKVCFENFDCVSWGGYAGDSETPSPSGTPFNGAGGLAQGCAVRRDASAGNANTLEASDDTNDSAADFDFAESASPVNNLGQAGRDSEGSACGPKIASRTSSGFLAGSLSAWSVAALMLLFLTRLLARHPKEHRQN